MKTINVTLKVDTKHLIKLEDELRGAFNVIDFRILPSTEKLYNEDKTFKKLVGMVKKAQRERDIYINEHN